MMRANARKLIAWTLILGLSVAGTAGAELPLTACSQALAGEAEQEARVELIWYPSSEYFLLSHTELIVGDKTWDGFIRYKTPRATNVTERMARTGGRGFVRIPLRVRPNELHRIEEFLRTHEWSRGTCSGGLCRAINAGSGVKMPFAIGQVPTLLVMYLSLAKILGNGRIGTIEWVGPRGIRQFIRPSSLGFIGPIWELHLVHQWGTIAVDAARVLLETL